MLYGSKIWQVIVDYENSDSSEVNMLDRSYGLMGALKFAYAKSP